MAAATSASPKLRVCSLTAKRCTARRIVSVFSNALTVGRRWVHTHTHNHTHSHTPSAWAQPQQRENAAAVVATGRSVHTFGSLASSLASKPVTSRL